MEIINTKITLFYNNEIVLNYTTDFEIVESIPKSKNIVIDWNNLEEIQNTYFNDLCNFFEIHNTRKGRKIIKSYYYTIFDNLYLTIKEWKNPKLNMSIQVDYCLCQKVSIDDIMKYRDAEKAIKYLIEKGLTIIHN